MTNNSQIKNLYSISSMLKTYPHHGRHYTDVHVFWCVEGRDEPVIPYSEGIENYAKAKDAYNESFYFNPFLSGFPAEYALDELFTKEEADVFKSLLLDAGEDCEVKEVTLPISPDSIPACCLCPGEFNSSMCLRKPQNFDSGRLPYEIVCYCYID